MLVVSPEIDLYRWSFVFAVCHQNSSDASWMEPYQFSVDFVPELKDNRMKDFTNIEATEIFNCIPHRSTFRWQLKMI